MALLVVVLQFFVSLSILVMIHEFGHFLMARIFKVRVEKFYLFFNPFFTLFRFKPKKSETEYGIGWLPLGGYVKLAGMIDESLDRDQMKQEPKDWEFRTKPAWQRLLIMVMGVVFNFLLALFIYSMLSFSYGERYIPWKNIKHGLEFCEIAKEAGFQDGDLPLSADGVALIKADEESIRAMAESKEVCVLRDGKEVNIAMPEDFVLRLIESKQAFVGFRYPFVVDSVVAGTRAERAGLMSGDSIVAVMDNQQAFVSTCTTIFASHRNEPLNVKVSRMGEVVDLTLTPDHNGKIGVYMKPMSAFCDVETVNYGFFESFSVGVKKGIRKLSGYVGDMKYIATKQGAQSVGGFMLIGKLFPYPFNAQMFWEITAFLSLILAFMNILPIPALDGGHVLFLLYEVVSGKKPSEKFLVSAQMIGMLLLFALMIFANMNDIERFFG